MKFEIGDTVRLKERFYDDGQFGLMDRNRRKTAGTLRGQTITVTELCDFSCCINIGGKLFSTDLFEKVPQKASDKYFHQGEWYKKVERQAKVGELMLVVNQTETKGKYKNRDVLKSISNNFGSNPYAYYKNESGYYLYNHEYVVLEPIARCDSAPEVKRLCINCEHGGVFADCKSCIQNPLDRPLFVEKGSKPSKRQYTADQIGEAKAISYEILTHPGMCKATLIHVGERGVTYDNDDESNHGKPHVTVILLDSRFCSSEHIYKKIRRATAFCSPNDEWNTDIGIMVALCKLTNTQMPKWVRGE